MKSIIFLIILIGCGQKRIIERTKVGPAGPKGDTVVGPKGDKGDSGSKGDSGNNGSKGHNALIKFLNGSALDLPCGGATGYTLFSGTDENDNGELDNSEISVGTVICNGIAGQNGMDGQNGIDGIDGQDGATGPQGMQGDRGADAQSPQFTPVVVIEPCGHNSSPYKEALLGLQGGAVFGSFTKNSDALTVRDTLIPNGTYMDTDDSFCTFSVTTDGEGNRTVSWNEQTTANGYHALGGSASYNAQTQEWNQN